MAFSSVINWAFAFVYDLSRAIWRECVQMLTIPQCHLHNNLYGWDLFCCCCCFCCSDTRNAKNDEKKEHNKLKKKQNDCLCNWIKCFSPFLMKIIASDSLVCDQNAFNSLRPTQKFAVLSNVFDAFFLFVWMDSVCFDKWTTPWIYVLVYPMHWIWCWQLRERRSTRLYWGECQIRLEDFYHKQKHSERFVICVDCGLREAFLSVHLTAHIWKSLVAYTVFHFENGSFFFCFRAIQTISYIRSLFNLFMK